MRFRLAPRSTSSVLALAAALAASWTGSAAASAREDAAAGAPAAANALRIESFLRAGPAPLLEPAWKPGADTKPRLGKGNLFDAHPVAADTLETLDPREGDTLRWPGRDPLVFAPGDGTLAALDGPSYTLLAARLDAGRFVKTKLVARSFHRLRVHLDGKEVASLATAAAKDAADRGSATAEIGLEPGPHRLLIEVWHEPGGHPVLDVQATLEPAAADAGPLPVRATLDPVHRVCVADLLDTSALDSVLVSDDGQRAILNWRRPEVPADDARRWTTIHDLAGGAQRFSSEGRGPLDRCAFVPGTHAVSYVTTDGDGATIRVAEDGAATRVFVRGVKDLQSYTWLPGGAALVYAVREAEDKDKDGVERVRGLNDRRGFSRTASQLWLAAEDGGRVPLTAGERGAELVDVSPDGRTLLVQRTEHGVPERPFSTTELFELELDTHAVRAVLRTQTFLGGRYVLGGTRILVLAGPSFARGAGSTIARAEIPNDYDGELFLMDRDGTNVEPLTRDFDPSVQQAEPYAGGTRALVRAEQGDRVAFFALDLETRALTPVAAGLEVVEKCATAAAAARAVAIGSSAREPERAVTLDLPGGDGARANLAEPRLLVEPDAARWSRVRIGAVEPFAYETEDGTRIEGRIHLPPDFDPARSWPCIFYYYGGTAPTERAFGGRYPLNLWAAHGYVVFTLNPSGATGYGQEFAARHVNDWGQRSGDDLLGGLDRFLASHPYVDSKRIGCIGASFGGFMTQSLITRTDRFAAAISHAGIASIASYWGEGAWGYEYSAIATADAYPWNRPDVYVERSPLFHADRIHTPLLLLHGDADNNVPIGESDQMYTALKLLGRDVEYVRVSGENHHILSYPKRALWMKTILAYFDRTLKGEPEWWNALHGD